MPYQECRTADNRMRWIVYPCLFLAIAVLLAAGAMLALGTFTRLQQTPLPPQARHALEKMRQTQGMPPGAWDGKLPVPAYADPQAQAAYQQSARAGDWAALARMQRQGKVISLSSGTPIWYQPSPDAARLTPVRLMNGRHFGRTYWVESRYLRSR